LPCSGSPPPSPASRGRAINVAPTFRSAWPMAWVSRVAQLRPDPADRKVGATLSADNMKLTSWPGRTETKVVEKAPRTFAGAAAGIPRSDEAQGAARWRNQWREEAGEWHSRTAGNTG